MFSVTKRDPMLDLLCQLEQRMGRSFNEPLRTFEWPGPEAATTAWQPLVDIFEEPDVIRLVAEVPGVKPEDVKISVEANLLTIKGTKEQVAEADDHAAEGGDGQASSDPGGSRTREGVERLTSRGGGGRRLLLFALLLVSERRLHAHACGAHRHCGRLADTRRHDRLFPHATSFRTGVRDRHGVVAVPGGGGHADAATARRRAGAAATARTRVAPAHAPSRARTGSTFTATAAAGS